MQRWISILLGAVCSRILGGFFHWHITARKNSIPSLWHHLLFLFKHISPTPLMISNGIRQPSVNPRLFFPQKLALRLKSPFEKRKSSQAIFLLFQIAQLEGSCYFLFNMSCWEDLHPSFLPCLEPTWPHSAPPPGTCEAGKGYSSTAFSRIWGSLAPPRPFLQKLICANRSKEGTVLRDRVVLLPPQMSFKTSLVGDTITFSAW